MRVGIRQALQEGISFLKQKGIDFPHNEAEVALAFLLGRDKLYLYAHGEDTMPGKKIVAFREILRRRSGGVPLAYIMGTKEFMGLNFTVNEKVLIPRPETEHLVEAVIDWCKRICGRSGMVTPLEILDLGTGCGNIAISLAHYLPFSFVTGIDLGKEAVELACQNAQSIGVSERSRFLCGSCWEPLFPGKDKFNVIVSNPPYVSRGELDFLSPEVQSEPRLALDGGSDGLDAYRCIFAGVQKYLAAPGLLALEIGDRQAEAILGIASSLTFLQNTEIIKDYAGRERVVLFNTRQPTAGTI